MLGPGEPGIGAAWATPASTHQLVTIASKITAGKSARERARGVAPPGPKYSFIRDQPFLHPVQPPQCVTRRASRQWPYSPLLRSRLNGVGSRGGPGTFFDSDERSNGVSRDRLSGEPANTRHPG